ncbi:MAG: helix-turn-helix domain-containing protein [Oscillospiraceae bacterium]|nr:helix-turn-helix domain-containing protein [Oscillospiraceae bacterium]MDE6841762.1 helix-turn-helix domain-containing protein [Oscillospiraceae bacterium]
MTNSDFARTLSLLRQEKGISQRQAAKTLGISQALLSHYENGAREPGLMFVVKACDFYSVSADFLLGRTLSRDGTTILDADTLYDVSDERDNVLRGSVLATLSKKLVVNSVGLLFDLLSRVGSKKAIRAAANYLSTTVYILFRHLHLASPSGNDDIFSMPREWFVAGLSRADMLMSEAEYVSALSSPGKNAKFPPLDHEAMKSAYPGTYQSLLQIVHTCGERLNSEMASHMENTR